MRVLFVCRANVCRSPVAAALLQRRLDERGVEAEARSAGLRPDSVGVSRGLAGAAAEWDIDLRDHQTTALAPALLGGAELVLAMEHHQVSDIVAAAPEAWPRTFTVKELVRRAGEKGSREVDESFRAWVGRLHAGRTRLGLVGAWHDDVPDPVGRPETELERTIAELDGLVARLVEVGWPRRVRR